MQIKRKPQTSGFPRVECLAPDCKRGTTRIRPLDPGRFWLDHDGVDPEWFCPKHWKMVPKSWKRRRRRMLRAYDRACEAKDRQRGQRIERILRSIWRRMKFSIVIPDRYKSDDGLPVAMADEIRRLGL